jgi:hydroxymethylglutaryl-CoA reductase
VTAVVLAGEISLLGAITSEEWAGAHEALGRNRPQDEG